MSLTEALLVIAAILILIDVFIQTDITTIMAWGIVSFAVARELPFHLFLVRYLDWRAVHQRKYHIKEGAVMKQSRASIILFVMSLFITSSSIAQAQELRIENQGTNKVYFSYGGQPVFGFGTLGDEFFNHIGVQDALDIDWFDATGQNQIRGYVGNVSGTISGNEYHYIKDSNGKFNLDAFNTSYWNNIRANIQRFKNAGIILQISFFEGASHYDTSANAKEAGWGWNDNYFNPAINNNSYTDGMRPTECGGINYWTDEPMRLLEDNNDSSLLDAQKRWVIQVLDYTALGNTYYDVTHEMFLTANSCPDAKYTSRSGRWINEIISTVRAWEQANSKTIILGMDASRGNSNAILSNNGFDYLLWGKPHKHNNVKGWRAQYNKPYVPDESWDSNSKKWHYKIFINPQPTDMHILAPNRTRKYILKMMADKVPFANVYGSKSANRGFEGDAFKIREIFNKIVPYYPDMVVTENKISSAPTNGKHMLSSSQAAFVYLETGPNVETQSVSSGNLQLDDLNLPSGSIDIEIYHPSTGVSSTSRGNVSNGSVSLSLPSFNNDLAVIITVGGGGGTPELTSPADGSTLSGSTHVFSWTANGAYATNWWLNIGSVPEEYDIYDSGDIGSNTTHAVSSLPTDGSTYYVTLRYMDAQGWTFISSTFIASGASTNPDEIICSSINNQRVDCPAGGIVVLVELIEQYSTTGCELDVTFGFEGNSIYVTDGCRGLFRVTLGLAAPMPPSSLTNH